jgi:hypothetical protein
MHYHYAILCYREQPLTSNGGSPSKKGVLPVEWAFYSKPESVQHMGIDHRGGDIKITGKLVHSADISR